jgi:hypothetical protein
MRRRWSQPGLAGKPRKRLAQVGDAQRIAELLSKVTFEPPSIHAVKLRFVQMVC